MGPRLATKGDSTNLPSPKKHEHSTLLAGQKAQVQTVVNVDCYLVQVLNMFCSLELLPKTAFSEQPSQKKLRISGLG